MDSRFGTGLMEGGLKGFRLVEGDIVLSDFFGGRESKVMPRSVPGRRRRL